jgi:hypothetical protein
MFARILTAAGLFLIVHVPAGAAEFTPDGVEKAIAACQALNTYGPVEVIKTTDDGLGDLLIWIKDKDGDLWMCDANVSGAVFTNVMMEGDLLKGDGAQVVGLQTIANTTSGAAPADVAAAVCMGVGNIIEPMQVVVTVEDGLGDYVTWMKNASEQLWLCNSSGDAKIYGFEPVEMPLNDVPAAAEQRIA